MSILTPTSFHERLPGAPKFRAPGRRELAVLPAAPDGTTTPAAFDPEEARAAFESSLDSAVRAFIGHDPLDVAVVLTALCADLRQDDATVVGSLPASELGWALVAAGIPDGPAHTGHVAAAVIAIYDDLKAAVFLGQPSSHEPHAVPHRSPFEEFFSHSRLIRNTRFDDQEREALLALWSARHGIDRCRELLGLTIEQLLALVDGIVEVQRSRVSALPDRPMRRGDARAVAFRPSDLVTPPGASEAVVADVLAWLATPLGGGTRPTLHDDTDQIRLAPLLQDGDQYLLLSPDLLLRALIPLLAPRPPRDRDAYQRRRARWVEDTAIATLREFLRPELALSGLVHEHGESDGLLAFDNTLILIEAKAKSLRVLRGLDQPARYDTDVKELVVAACDSLRRGRRALRRGAVFRDGSGKTIKVPVDDHTRIISVIVTLEQFWPISAQLWRLRQSGRLSSREPLPWMLTLAHLQTICELLEWPAELVDFLTRRLELDRRIIGSDEIDFVMAYLRWGLDFEQILADDVGSVLLPTGNDEVNEWMFSERGWWDRRCPRPQLEMSPAVMLESRAKLNELDERRPAGWVARSQDVLDWAIANSPRTPRRRPS